MPQEGATYFQDASQEFAADAGGLGRIESRPRYLGQAGFKDSSAVALNMMLQARTRRTWGMGLR